MCSVIFVKGMCMTVSLISYPSYQSNNTTFKGTNLAKIAQKPKKNLKPVLLSLAGLLGCKVIQDAHIQYEEESLQKPKSPMVTSLREQYIPIIKKNLEITQINKPQMELSQGVKDLISQGVITQEEAEIFNEIYIIFFVFKFVNEIRIYLIHLSTSKNSQNQTRNRKLNRK